MGTREFIDMDSTAVLAFDGGEVPCDRYIMRTFCSVIRTLLDSDAECAADERGRTVLPMPGQAPGPFQVAVDLLHGCRHVWDLSLDDALAAMACLEYLGCAAYDMALDGRVWSLVQDWGLEAARPDGRPPLMALVPRLLRNGATAAAVVRRLIVLRPLWNDFRRDVLCELDRANAVDQQVVGALVAYAPNFYPPALVVDWALTACRNMTRDLALRLASQHGVMYHPSEVPAVLRRLAEVSDAVAAGGGADGGSGLGSLLRMTLASMELYDAVPCAASKAHGSLVKYHDIPIASVNLALESRLPSALKVTRWLKVSFWQDGRFEVAFNPRRIDDSTPEPEQVQLRIMCFDAHEEPRGTCAEAWYLYDGLQYSPEDDDIHLLSHATRTLGQAAGITQMLRLKTARRLRLDFFFGKRSVLESPFDAASASKMMTNFLLLSQQ